MIQKAILTAACLVYSVFRGKADGPIDPADVKSIAVLQLSQLGDVVGATPSFRAVKEKYPNAKLYAVVQKVGALVLRGNTDVDECIVYEDSVFSMIKKFKAADIDVAVLHQTSFEALAALYLSGIKHIVAVRIVGRYSPFETRPYRWVRKLVCVLPKQSDANMSEEHLKLLRPLGIEENDITRELVHTNEAGITAEKYYASKSIDIAKDFVVIVFPSSGNKIKSWVPDRFATLIQHIEKNESVRVVLLGGPNDDVEVDEVLECLSKDSKIIVSKNEFSIEELKAVIAKASMFISVDCGPLYIADAFDVPTIDILGPAGDYVPPKGKYKRWVSNRGDNEPAIYPLNNRDVDYEEARRQAEAISAESVIEIYNDLYDAVLRK